MSLSCCEIFLFLMPRNIFIFYCQKYLYFLFPEIFLFLISRNILISYCQKYFYFLQLEIFVFLILRNIFISYCQKYFYFLFSEIYIFSYSQKKFYFALWLRFFLSKNSDVPKNDTFQFFLNETCFGFSLIDFSSISV